MIDEDNYSMTINRSDQVMIRKLSDPEKWFMIDKDSLYKLIEYGLKEGIICVTWSNEKFQEVAI